MVRGAFALLLCALAAAPAIADAGARVELPIRAVILSDGVRRYTVTITIGGQQVEVGLDTGSTGLRVLAMALPPTLASAEGLKARYHYGSGVQYSGDAITVPVTIGAATGNTKIARIDHVACVGGQRDCPAAAMDPADYRIMGDGLKGEGFGAIMGIGLKSDAVPNPLKAIGIDRWIVELPRPGDGGIGRLILNPTDAEISRYKTFNLIGDGNLVAGCIVAERGSFRLCAPAMLDSGANGLRVQGGKPANILPQGTPAALVIGDGGDTVAMPVTIGMRDQAAGMRLYPSREGGGLTLSFGIAPYFRWSVLYDARAHRIGVGDR
jgi:hypothetical protein